MRNAPTERKKVMHPRTHPVRNMEMEIVNVNFLVSKCFLSLSVAFLRSRFEFLSANKNKRKKFHQNKQVTTRFFSLAKLVQIG